MRRLFALTALCCAAGSAFAQFYGNDKSIQEIGSGRRAYASEGSSTIGVDQKLDDMVPMDLKFTDSSGKEIELRELFRGRPIILMPVFYECTGVCTLELNGMLSALKDFKKDSIGKDFDVVTFTIKPTETLAMAAEKKAFLLDQYNRPGAEEGWSFLVGDIKDIKALTDAVGFRYEYDPETGSVIHPAAAVVLTPDGQISQYFLETSYNPGALLDSLRLAAKGRVGKKAVDQAFWNCVEIDPLTGKKSLNVLKAMRLGGLFTLIALVCGIVFMSIKYKTAPVPQQGTEGGEGGA